ncbi:MAG: acyl-CoA dehydrogenase family protein [Actinomycetota bacterium]|nr:acyl-CoA dehydrogenase family protein [Actinomycetota bacterium]
MDLDAYRRGLDVWLDDHATALAPDPGDGTLAGHMTQLARVKRLGYDAGWMRWGWPERAGGLGGPSIVRAYLGEALMARGLVEPGGYSMTEVLAPTLIDFAPADLAADMVPRLLRGDEIWCQGFSEPGTGSNLAALSCRATPTADGWSVRGQKVWTSYAQFAARCVLLTRTGTPESAHRGITALFVDMDTPGITVRPLLTMHGVEEFCEVFFDDVAVPGERTLGPVGGGWAVAMDLLPYERSTSLWHRGAWLQRRLDDFLATVGEGMVDPAALGEVLQMLLAFRARSRSTQRRLAGGERLGPETSIDKVLLSTLEQAAFDLIGTGLEQALIAGCDLEAQRWRADFLYSRASTIYGGSAEIQRNIIARRLLDLGDDR